MTHDPIVAADRAEEHSAAEALRAATSLDELVSTWWRDADHFQGEQRERLQDIYAAKVAKFAPMARAG